MKIRRGRLKQVGSVAEFISVKGRIKGMIENHPGDNFDFVLDDNGRAFIKSFGVDHIDPDLVGKSLPIIDNSYFAKFNADGTIDVVSDVSESLPRQSTVDQMKRLQAISAKTDIGERTKNIGVNGTSSPLTRVQSYEEFEKANRNFIPSWNVNGEISPLREKKKKKKNK